VIVEPDNLPVLEVVHVEFCEIVFNSFHLSRNLALGCILKWPMPTGKDLS
jgi:hypothetical protein